MKIKLVEMKRFLLFIIIISGFVVSCGAGKKNSDNEGTSGFHKVTAINTMNAADIDTIDLGRLKQGETVEFRFGLQNTDSTAMVILDILNSCGCTSLDYDKRPIMPGDTALVLLSYNSRGQIGVQHKMMPIITSFNKQPFYVYIHADVYK